MSNALRNWKTTFAGLAMLIFTGVQIYKSPALLLDPSTDGKIAGAVGLIVAKDSDKTGTTPPTQ